MNQHDYAALNARYGIADHVVFKEGPGGFALVEVSNAHGTATLVLQGAQLLTWVPRTIAPGVWSPVVWESPQAKYAQGKSVRGGVPVCWPWFGPHSAEPAFPTHGFARTLPWEVAETRALAGDVISLIFRFMPAEQTRTWWPHASRLEYHITIGASLEMELVTHNLGKETMVITEALHTYFGVSDVRAIHIHGLDGVEYLDKVGGGRKRQLGPIDFSGETDRVYVNTADDCVIDDPGFRRRIRISKRGSRSTVVWNPWLEKAAKLGDMGEDGYLRMVCVESANAFDDAVSIAAGGDHRLSVRYFVESY